MLKESEIRIYRSEEFQTEFGRNGSEFFRNPISIVHAFCEISFRTAADIRRMGFDIRSKKEKAITHVSKDDFIGMKGKSQFVRKKRSNLWKARYQKFAVGMNEHEIVHIPSVMSYLQVPFYVRIERMEVEVCENLTRKIPNGKSDSFWNGEKALVFWKPRPILTLSTYDAIPRRIVAENFPQKIPEVSGSFPLKIGRKKGRREKGSSA